MSAARAKRRMMRWERYAIKTESRTPNRKHYGGYHRGHIRAIWIYTGKGRAAPHGLRTAWLLRRGA